MTQLPPGPRVPALAQLVQMSMNPYRFAERCRERYGDVYTMRLPGQPPLVVIAEPAAVRELLTGGYEDQERYGDAVRFILGDHAVIFQQDEPHKETRRLMLPPFRGERMRAYGDDMARLTDQVIDGWSDDAPLSMQDELQKVTLRVILRCVFGITEEERLSRLGRLTVEYLAALMTPWAFGLSLVLTGRRMRGLLEWRSRRARQGGAISRWPLQSIADRLGAIDAMLFEEIARCRALSPEALAARPDILSMLVAARFDDGTAMSDAVLRDHLMTLLIGGHETTATSLTWALAWALRHPGTLERMRDEVDRVMGDGFDATRVKQLEYVGAVASEAMRLSPIAHAVSRVLRRPLQAGRFVLQPGTTVSPSIYLVQHDPRVWPDPERFDPERFVTQKASIYQFFPFGAGVWRCLGGHFAEYEMRVVLARLVARVDFAAEPGDHLAPRQRGFTIAPATGLPVRPRARRSGAAVSAA